jgi:hypothetical protein
MAKDDKKPGVLHSFLGGMIFTIVLVVVIPVLTAIFIAPEVDKYLGEVSFWEVTSETVVTAIMLLILILFLLLLGGGKIFKKYGVIGVIGLIAAYWWLGNIYNAILPVAVILLFVIIGFVRGK